MKKTQQNQNEEIMLRAAVISHIGCVRGNNEDNFYFNGDYMEMKEVNDGTMFRAIATRNHHLMCICDGMGGLEGGERASRLVVTGIHALDKPMSIQDVSIEIDSFARQVSEQIQQDALKSGGDQTKEGTTLALVYMTGGTMHVANVGDSRVYVLRNGKLIQVSMDHTRIYQMMLAGQLTKEQVRNHPESNRIDHYVGMPKDRISNDFVFHKNCSICNSDRLFLCTDGVSDLMSDEKLEEFLSNNAAPLDAARQIIEYALEMGGKDNSTVIVADVTGAQLPMTTPSAIAALGLLHESTSTINTTQ